MHPRPTVWSSFKSFHSIWTPREQEHVVILILMTIQWQLGSNNINATFHVSCGNKCHIYCGNACVNLCIHCHKSVCIQSHTSFLWQWMQRMTHVAQKANALPVCRRWPHKWNRTLLHFIQFQTCIYCAQRDLPWQYPDRRSELWKLSGMRQKGLSGFVKNDCHNLSKMIVWDLSKVTISIAFTHMVISIYAALWGYTWVGCVSTRF